MAYLDTLNKVREDGRIDISVYRKLTHTDRYLQFYSHQPIHHKAAVAKSLYSRTAKVSSNPLNKMSEVEHMNRIMESNGYPKEFLKKQRRIVFETNPQEDRSKGDDDDNDRKGIIVLPYIRSVTERLKRVLQKHNFVVAEKPVVRLKNILTKIKDKVPTKKHTVIVYTIPCSNCDIKYIGETGRSLQTRRCEHKRSVRYNKVEQSALAEYVQQTGHAISWENMQPIIKDNRLCQRRWNEACVIFKTKNFILNTHCGKVSPDVYKSLIDQL